MDGESYLYTLVEVGVALAGFSAIALALESKGPHHSDAYQRVITSRLVERSLMGSFFAILPVLLDGFGLPARIVWLISSGTLAIYAALRGVQTYRKRAIVSQLGVSRPVVFLLLAILLAVLIIQVFNALGVIVSQGMWWYALGVTWLLVTAGYTFVIYLRAWIKRPDH